MVDFQIHTNTGIKTVTGYKINKSYYCHKSAKDDWVITDYDSGLLIAKNLKTGKDCFTYIKNTDLSGIEKLKERTFYINHVKEMTEWREKN